MTSLSKWPPGGHIGFFGFQTLTLVWLWLSTPNLSCTILMYMYRSLLIFSNANFKMATRQPYWIFWFPDSNFSLALNINETNCLRTTGSTNLQKTSIVKPTMSSISWNAHVVKSNMSGKQSETSLHDSRNISLISDIIKTHRSLNTSI